MGQAVFRFILLMCPTSLPKLATVAPRLLFNAGYTLEGEEPQKKPPQRDSHVALKRAAGRRVACSAQGSMCIVIDDFAHHTPKHDDPLKNSHRRTPKIQCDVAMAQQIPNSVMSDLSLSVLMLILPRRCNTCLRNARCSQSQLLSTERRT